MVNPKAHSGSATQHIKDTEPARYVLPRRQIASDQNRILETIAWHFIMVLSLGCPSTCCTLTPALKRREKIDQFESSVEQTRKNTLCLLSYWPGWDRHTLSKFSMQEFSRTDLLSVLYLVLQKLLNLTAHSKLELPYFYKVREGRSLLFSGKSCEG